MKVLLFYFIIMTPYPSYLPGTQDWRESQPYLTLQACKDGMLDYQMNEDPGPYSECYARPKGE